MQNIAAHPETGLTLSTRRSFLKAAPIAAAAAALPIMNISEASAFQQSAAGAGNAESGATSGLYALLEEHAEVRDALAKSYADEDALYDLPGRPEFPKVTVAELPSQYHIFGRDRELMTSESVGQFFDRHENFQLGNSFFSEAEMAPRRAVLNTDRPYALKLFALRDAVYQRWCFESGLAAVEDRSQKLCRLESDLDTCILDWKCGTIDEVHAVAIHIDRIYGNRMSQEALTAFVKGLLPALV